VLCPCSPGNFWTQGLKLNVPDDSDSCCEARPRAANFIPRAASPRPQSSGISTSPHSSNPLAVVAYFCTSAWPKTLTGTCAKSTVRMRKFAGLICGAKDETIDEVPLATAADNCRDARRHAAALTEITRMRSLSRG